MRVSYLLQLFRKEMRRAPNQGGASANGKAGRGPEDLSGDGRVGM